MHDPKTIRRKRMIAHKQLIKVKQMSVADIDPSIVQAQPSIFNEDVTAEVVRPKAENRKRRAQSKALISGDELIPSLPVINNDEA